jgi:predicted GNAT family N-acyltransferase
MTDFAVRIADWSHDLPALRSVRTHVFIEEQKVPEELEWDEIDSQCLHALALADGEPVGTGRLTPDGHIGRMAVLREWRDRGVGSRLLETLIEAARDRGDRACRLNAQTYVMGFYARYGFRPEGEEFMEAGIPHRGMVLHFDAPQRDESVHGHETLADALAGVARRARHAFALYATDLAPRISDRAELADVLRALAISSARAQIRLLCRDARDAARDGHALLRLAARLPSRFAVHRISPEDEAPGQVFAVADAVSAFYQSRPASPTATLALDSPLFARDLMQQFDALWSRSEPDPEARRLRI